MTNNLPTANQERSVLQWGGLAGILGGILFVLAMVVVILGPAGMDDPAGLADWVTRFPEIKAARVVENLVYLTALMLEVPLFLALYYALRRTSLAPALFGTVLGMLGLSAMMISAIPHVAHAALFDVAVDPGTTSADQATIAILWQAVWGMIDVTTYVGFFVVSSSLILLGVGMSGSPDFGKLLGATTLILGLIGLISAVLQIIDPASVIGVGSYFAGIIFYFVLGWKLFRLAGAQHQTE